MNLAPSARRALPHLINLPEEVLEFPSNDNPDLFSDEFPPDLNPELDPLVLDLYKLV